MRPIVLAPIVLLAACVDSTDPADGGFFNGVAGVSSGSYDARIEEREVALTAAQERNAQLNAQIAALQGQLDGAKAELARERARVRAQGGSIPVATNQQIDEVLSRTPAGSTPDAQAAALRRAIADARDLTNSLSNLSG